MSSEGKHDGLKAYDPIDLQRQLMEQEVVITRAIHALELAMSVLQQVHTQAEHQRTAAQLRSATLVALQALLGITELAGCYELSAQMEAMSA